jgi:hypothetical protein
MSRAARIATLEDHVLVAIIEKASRDIAKQTNCLENGVGNVPTLTT